MHRLKTSARIVFTGCLMSVVVLAFGLRTEATGFTFAMGNSKSKFDLRIDSQSFYNGQAVPSATWTLKNLKPGVDKFFNFSDIKPGDRGTTTISFHVNKDAWMCLDFEKLKEYENGQTEPEALVDPTGGANSGELADGTEFFAWYDDGDTVFEVGETPLFGTTTGAQAATKVFDNKTYALADSVFGTPFTASSTRYVGITWCAGDLAVNLATAVITCDATAMGNEAQTDSFTVDISIRAEGAKDNKKFRCLKKGTTCEYAGPVKVNVVNNGTIINNTSSNANTGGNSAGGSQGGNGGAGGNGGNGSSGSNGGNGGSGGSGGNASAGGTVVTGNATSSAGTVNVVNTVRVIIDRVRGR